MGGLYTPKRQPKESRGRVHCQTIKRWGRWRRRRQRIRFPMPREEQLVTNQGSHAVWPQSGWFVLYRCWLGLPLRSQCCDGCFVGGWLSPAAAAQLWLGKPIDWHPFDLMSFLFKLSITHFALLSYNDDDDKIEKANHISRQNDTRTRDITSESQVATLNWRLKEGITRIVTSTRNCRWCRAE